jgi:hypothetical protein
MESSVWSDDDDEFLAVASVLDTTESDKEFGELLDAMDAEQGSPPLLNASQLADEISATSPPASDPAPGFREHTLNRVTDYVDYVGEPESSNLCPPEETAEELSMGEAIDNGSYSGAFVRVEENPHGIWVSGWINDTKWASEKLPLDFRMAIPVYVRSMRLRVYRLYVASQLN